MKKEDLAKKIKLEIREITSKRDKLPPGPACTQLGKVIAGKQARLKSLDSETPFIRRRRIDDRNDTADGGIDDSYIRAD